MLGTWVKSLILPAGNTSLLIETSREGWSKCFLVNSERLCLGAGDFIVLSRLRDALSSQPALDESAAGEIEGLPVAWRLSLAEAHHVLYVGDDGPDRVLFWQDARTSPVSIVGIMRLSPVQHQSWFHTLGRILEEAKKSPLVAA